MTLRNLQTIVAITAGVLILSASAEAFQQTVGVQMKATVTIDSEVVRVGDIATVTSQDSQLQLVVQNTEICSLRLQERAKPITRRMIQTRLVLAGLTLNQIRIIGENETLVSHGAPQTITDAQIEEEVHRVLSERMGSRAEDVSVQLQSALVQQLSPAIRETEGITLKIVPPAKAALGNVSIAVQFWKGNQILVTRYAIFQVQKRHRVAIARASLSREIPLDERAVQFEERFFGEHMDELDPSQVYGRNLKAVVTAGSVIQMRDMQASTTGKSIAVKRGENVRATTVSNALRIVMRDVEALQDGGIGDTIELRNRSTGTKFFGKVAAPGQVLIHLN